MTGAANYPEPDQAQRSREASEKAYRERINTPALGPINPFSGKPERPKFASDIGHGWVIPNPSGIRTRCGGPAICRECANEFKAFYGGSWTDLIGAPKESDSAVEMLESTWMSLPKNGPLQMIPIAVGCICPPGANKECERPDCPRQNLINQSGRSKSGS